MKSPLWIVNSILAIILVALFLFVMYSMRTLFVRPKARSIKVTARPEVGIKEDVKPQHLSLIYEEHDLFSTYRPAITPVKKVDVIPAIPTQPKPIPVKRDQKKPVLFLPPLPLKISGIIASSNEAKSQISLVNTGTGKTESFKVGDKVLDAYILRIFPHKVSVIRSNGQQETLYMYPDEAKVDTSAMQDTIWPNVIQQQSERAYLVNPTAFGSRVHSLATLFDMLDITTASQAGKPLGIRIGKMKPTSMGFAAGLQPGDIILKVSDIAPISTDARMSLFNKVAALDLGAQIPVQFMRGDRIHTNIYTLFNLADPTATLEGVGQIQIPPRRVQPSRVPPRTTNNNSIQRIAQQNPMAMRKRDLDTMKRYGGRSASMIQPTQSRN